MKTMLLTGSIYIYQGMKVRYLGHVKNGMGRILLLKNGKVIKVFRHEIIMMKLRQIA